MSNFLDTELGQGVSSKGNNVRNTRTPAQSPALLIQLKICSNIFSECLKLCLIPSLETVMELKPPLSP